MCLGTKTERPVWRNANNASAQTAKAPLSAASSEAPQFLNLSSGDLAAASKVNWLFYDDRTYGSPGSEFDYDAKCVTQSSSSPSTESEISSDTSEQWSDVRSDATYYTDTTASFSSNMALNAHAYPAYQAKPMVKSTSGYGSFSSAFDSVFNSCSGFQGGFASQYHPTPEPMAAEASKFACGYRPDVVRTAEANPMMSAQRTLDPSVAHFEAMAKVSAMAPVHVPVHPAMHHLSMDLSVKVERKSPAIVDAMGNGSRSYRQQTSELINKLDKLLKFPAKQGAVKGRTCKGKSRRSPKDLMKPRPRNVVLKQAVELIWRIKCDEEALALREQEAAKRDQNADTAMSPESEAADSDNVKDVKEDKDIKEVMANCDGSSMNVETDVFLTKWVASFDPRAVSKCSSSSSLDIIDDAGFQWDQSDSDPGILSLFREQPMYGRESHGFSEQPNLQPIPPPPL